MFLGRHSLMAGLIVWSFEGQLFSTLTHLLKRILLLSDLFLKRCIFFHFLHSQKGLLTFITFFICFSFTSFIKGVTRSHRGSPGETRGDWGRLLGPAWPSLTQLGPAWLSLAQGRPAWALLGHRWDTAECRWVTAAQ